MKTEDIINAWVRIRKIDNTIPDEVLDFMKDAAIEKLSGGNQVLIEPVKESIDYEFNLHQQWKESPEEQDRNHSGIIKHFQ